MAKYLLASGSAIVLCLAATDAMAATDQAGNQSHSAAASAETGLEEIIVTARKREENMQNVPIAITSLSAKSLADRGIKTAGDLALVVPSLNVQTGTSWAGSAAAIFQIRGMAASDSVLEVSQAVGLYQDGVNIPHPGGSNLGFFDVSRVDVLKGPQGTLYGRNTTGGAVNITTRGADFNGIHGTVEAEYGSYRDFRLSGAVNLPLIPDVLALRLASQRWYREGFGVDVTNGERLGDDRNDFSNRATLLFEPNTKLRAELRVEYDHANRNGSLEQPAFNTIGAAGISAGSQLGVPLVYASSPDEFCGSLPFTCDSVGAAAAAGNAAIDRYVNNPNMMVGYADGPNFATISQWHTGLTVSYDVSPNVQLKSITGMHQTTIFHEYDLDGTPFQLVSVNQPGVLGSQVPVTLEPDVHYRQWTQELNLSGKAIDDRLTWMVGGFYSSEKGNSGTYHTAVTYLISNINAALNQAFDTDNVGYTTSGGANNQLDVVSRTWAVFTQNDFKIADNLSITAGLRYTSEHLHHVVQQYEYYFTNNTFDCLQNPGTLVSGPSDCNTTGYLANSAVSYLASIDYHPTPDILLYAKTARGNRAGALQPRAPVAIAPPAQPESATDYELGMKGEFFDHRLRLNVDVFRTNYSNLQATEIIANLNNPTAPWLVIQNAGRARFEGFEADFNALPARNWSLYGQVSYLKGKYLYYPNAVTPSNTLVDGTGLDVTDQQNSNPRWHYSIGSRYEVQAGPGMLAGELDWSWHSAGMLNATNLDTAVGDPAILPAYIEAQKKLRQAVGLLNGRIDYHLPEQNLTFSLFATNLLDKHYEVVGLLGSAIVGVTTGVVQNPRMIGFSITKKFGHE